jgi:uncharacterized protein YndB with AHSA1/START domain
MPAMQHLVFHQNYSAPREQVFAHFAEHENLAPLFGAKITRLNDGTDGERNGVGSARELRIGPLPGFVETITKVVPNELIQYRITKGSPLKDHQGEMHFSEDGALTHLRYEIRFGAKVPGLDRVVAAGLKRNIAKGLKKAPGAA